MIKSFKCKETEKIYHQEFSKRFPNDIQKIALRKLMMIDNSCSLNDLLIPPGNRLEALKGERDGQYSIRVNSQYRICFNFSNGDFENVEMVDYH